MTLLRTTRSSTPVAAEYDAITQAMRRCERHVRAFDPAPYRAETIARARELWLSRMESEHRSASVFAALCNQAMAAGATVDLVGVLLRMAQDELRHGEICGELVTALGGEAVREVAEAVAPVAMHADVTRAEAALRNIIYGCCLSETVNAARFVDTLETTTDPLVRDVNRELLSDETAHAQFGFHYLTAWTPWLDEHPDVRGSIAHYLRYAFAVLERDLSGMRMPTTALAEDESALGLPDARRTREVFYGTVEGAILPSLEGFGIPARRSWETRALAAQ